jgi:hypothetical protein
MPNYIEVLAYLRPNGGYVVNGERYEDIVFEKDCAPFTKEEFETAFIDLENKRTKDKNDKDSAKAILLKRLGITESEAKLLLS